MHQPVYWKTSVSENRGSLSSSRINGGRKGANATARIAGARPRIVRTSSRDRSDRDQDWAMSKMRDKRPVGAFFTSMRRRFVAPLERPAVAMGRADGP